MLVNGCKDVYDTTGTGGSLGHAGKYDCKEADPDLGSIRQEPLLSRPTQNWRPFSEKKENIWNFSYMQTFSPILNSYKQQLPFIDHLPCSMLGALQTRFISFLQLPRDRCYYIKIIENLRFREVR